jgi:hypothetical protein
MIVSLCLHIMIFTPVRLEQDPVDLLKINDLFAVADGLQVSPGPWLRVHCNGRFAPSFIL